MTKPNFFLVGAPKCGTSALSNYLGGNERVFFSRPKEPNYFARHMLVDRALRDVPTYRNDLDQYLDLFGAADPGRHLAIGEGSVIYLCSERSLREVHDFAPDAKIIVMLRNPVDLVYAMYYENRFHLIEDQDTFEEAWRLQTVREQGERWPKGVDRVEHILYGRLGSLGSQVETLLRIFPRQNVKWIFFEDFRSDTQKVYMDTLDFLGVPYDGKTEFRVVNPNEEIRKSFLIKIIRETRSLRLVSERMKRVFGVRSWGILETLQNRSARTVERPSLSPEMRAELIDYFADDIRLLEQVTGRDLSAWTEHEEQVAP